MPVDGGRVDRPGGDGPVFGPDRAHRHCQNQPQCLHIDRLKWGCFAAHRDTRPLLQGIAIPCRSGLVPRKGRPRFNGSPSLSGFHDNPAALQALPRRFSRAALASANTPWSRCHSCAQ
ncbi:hypothetical protein EI693_21630 [Pseudomonas oryziphila]|uniref:DUF1534 domain-containing protein n=1 Tax=Pseudomonas oryziphila TaxID=2894079 RepID=A0ABM7CVM5_9PSED|nr:hypothetical protein EI693_21630 [Pseudomonas oryziphila]